MYHCAPNFCILLCIYESMMANKSKAVNKSRTTHLGNHVKDSKKEIIYQTNYRCPRHGHQHISMKDWDSSQVHYAVEMGNKFSILVNFDNHMVQNHDNLSLQNEETHGRFGSRVSSFKLRSPKFRSIW